MVKEANTNTNTNTSTSTDATEGRTPDAKPRGVVTTVVDDLDREVSAALSAGSEEKSTTVRLSERTKLEQRVGAETLKSYR